MTGKGKSDAIVIVLDLCPSRREFQRETYYENGSFREFRTELGVIFDENQQYLTFLFPFTVEKTENGQLKEDEQTLQMFIEYTRERVNIIRPKYVITLGSHPTRYVINHFTSKTKVKWNGFRPYLLDLPIIVGDGSTLFACPHPYSFDMAKKNSNSDVITWWNTVFSTLSHLVGKSKTKRTGAEVINEMMTQSRIQQATTETKKRKSESQKNPPPLAKNQKTLLFFFQNAHTNETAIK